VDLQRRQQPELPLHPVSGTTYTISPQAAGDCLDVSGASTAGNAQVIQWPCNGQANQKFSVTGSGPFQIAASHSGKCVAPAGDSTASDTGLVQLPCTSAATRVWRLPAPAS
jgi:hypothetical protein